VFILRRTPKILFVSLLLVVGPAEVAGTSPKPIRLLLAELRVTEPVISPKYDRRFFPHWRDVDRNCRNTRDEVLARDSTLSTKGTCDITEGRWTSLYDGITVYSASELEIDHVVALKEAWISGAWAWSEDRRLAYANDLGYRGALLPVTESSHGPKKDKDPARWLPNRGVCDFAIHWIAVKWRWQLTIDLQEKAALTKLVKGDSGKRVVYGISRYVSGG